MLHLDIIIVLIKGSVNNHRDGRLQNYKIAGLKVFEPLPKRQGNIMSNTERVLPRECLLTAAMNK